MVRRWARGTLGILQIEVGTEGAPPIRPFLLVANHLSYLDVVVLMTLVDAVFVAKREVRGWPLFGPLARIIGTIFIDRESMRDVIRVGEAMRRARADGHGVVLFAEGTSSDGTCVLPLRPALLDAAARGEWPVHVASLSYHTAPGDPPASDALCWWGDMTFLPHLAGVCRLTHARARVTFTPQAIMASDRQALAKGLHSAISRSFTPSGHAS
jgi:1-acyl-sn-glycerol-3-phosphate acyltransferase